MADSPIVIMVCAPPRSGTSAVAGVMHHLGIPMGAWGGRRGPANPTGFFEDQLLQKIANLSIDEVWGEDYKNSFTERVGLFHWWLKKRSNDGPIIGGKYPRLCAMVPAMKAAIPNLRVIVPLRDAAESAKSFNSRRWPSNVPRDKIADAIQRTCEKRDAAIKRLKITSLRFPYKELVSDTRKIVAEIIAFCGIKPTAEQIESAVDFINPKLNHYS